MDIYDRKNKMRRKIYGKMLKKGQQKSSTRLYDRVIMRKKIYCKMLKKGQQKSSTRLCDRVIVR